jgi:hypothetical protein
VVEIGGSRLGGTCGADGSGSVVLSGVGSRVGLVGRLEALRAPQRFPTRPATLRLGMAVVPLDLGFGSAAFGEAGRPMMEEYDKDLAAERGCNGGAGLEASGSFQT